MHSHQPEDANYLAQWQRDIEIYGNKHYPKEALAQNIRGQLELLVGINANGTLHHITIRRSSGSNILDKAAINIVRRAAPFDPLPAEMAENIDVLEIVRTWQFRGLPTHS